MNVKETVVSEETPVIDWSHINVIEAIAEAGGEFLPKDEIVEKFESTIHEQPQRDPDEYRNLLLLTLANRVIRMTDVSEEIVELRTEVAQLRKTLKAAFLAIGHGPIGATFGEPAPRASIEKVSDNSDSFRDMITEDAVQEVLAKLKE